MLKRFSSFAFTVKISLYIIRLCLQRELFACLFCIVIILYCRHNLWHSISLLLFCTLNLFTDERFYLIFPTVSSFDCQKSSLSFLNILLTRWVWCGERKKRSIMINEGKREGKMLSWDSTGKKKDTKSTEKQQPQRISWIRKEEKLFENQITGATRLT